MRPFLTDLRLAIRSLRKTPAFTVTAIVTLGFAMTLCTAVLVVIKAYLFTQLPYPAADRLYSVRYNAPGVDGPDDMETLDWTALNDVVEHPIAWDLDMFYVLGGENAEAVPGAWVTPGFVDGLGIRPAIGRGFDADAFRQGAANVALISHRLWRSQFGGDTAAIGRQFTAYVSDRPEEAERFTIIGVLPETFWHLNSYTDIVVPLRAQTYPYMVRLRGGVSGEQAAARIAALVRAGARDVAPAWTPQVVSTRELYVARLRPILRSVGAAAALVLLVGCANVAGLLLLRATQRQKEIAVRTALGAGAAAIARMLIAESLVLAAAATACALWGTRLTLSVLAPLVERELGRTAPGGVLSFAIDWRVALAVAGAGLLTALVCGLAPLVTLVRPALAAALRTGARTATEGRRSQRLRATLIAVEIAASLALLSGAALMLRTVASLVNADLGFSADRVLIAPVTLRQTRYPDAPARLALFDRALDSLGSIAGVEMVGLTTAWPLQQQRLQGVEALTAGGRVPVRASVNRIAGAYLGALDIPVTSGRGFDESDRLGAEPVAVISETLSRRLWPDGAAIGSRVIVPQGADQGPPAMVECRIVGVVGDVRQDPADADLADIYVPLRQAPGRFASTIVRTTGSAEGAVGPLRAAFHDIDPEIAISGARPLAAVVDEIRARPQFVASLLTVFAAMAALLAIVGVYGMIAYAVRQREREIAIRMALGASPRIVSRLFLRQGAVVLSVGLTAGIAGGIASGRLLQSQLFGVRPGDPLTLAVAVAAFATAGLLAVWWPSRRAAGTDPALALRAD